VARAEKAGVCLLALSDHDSVSGFGEAQAAAQGRPLDLRCGVEINTNHGENVHILGYGIRWQDPPLLAALAEFRERRVCRLHAMLEKLGTLGVALSYEEVRGDSPETLGRAHVADALRRKGVVPTRAEAFRRFLAQGRPAYVESLGPSVEEAIALIRGAGGFAVVAHPGTVADKEEIAAWAKAGLEGIEAFYAGHSPSDIIRFQDLADRFGLVVTGGSDYHGRGSGRAGPMGVEVPEEVGRSFLERLSRCG
jgi:hypothetical protein